MTIPRNLSKLAQGADTSGVLGTANGGTGTTATPTAGGVIYGTGTAHAITAAGTTGQFLSSNGASAPSWVGAPASAMTLISTQTASTSATLSWTGLSGYNSYQLILKNLTPVSSGGAGTLLFGYGSTPTYISSGYNWSGISIATGSTAVSGLQQSNTIRQYCSGVNNGIGNSNGGTSGIITFEQTNAGYLMYNIQTISYSGSVSETNIFSGQLLSSNTISAIQFSVGGSNISSGTASLYGISS